MFKFPKLSLKRNFKMPSWQTKKKAPLLSSTSTVMNDITTSENNMSTENQTENQQVSKDNYQPSGTEKFRSILIKELEQILENSKNLDLDKELSLQHLISDLLYAHGNVVDRLSYIRGLRVEQERLIALEQSANVRKQQRDTSSLREAAKVMGQVENKRVDVNGN